MKRNIILFIIILVTSFMSFIYFKANAGGGFGVSDGTQGGNTPTCGFSTTTDGNGVTTTACGGSCDIGSICLYCQCDSGVTICDCSDATCDELCGDL